MQFTDTYIRLNCTHTRANVFMDANVDVTTTPAGNVHLLFYEKQ